MEKDNNEKKYSTVETFAFTKYDAPKVEFNTSRKYLLNGDNNWYFQYILDCYEGSTTNQAIINAFSRYIIGDGLKDKNGKNIDQYISDDDMDLIVQEYKTFGEVGILIIWNLAKTKPLKMEYVSMLNLGLNICKETMVTTGYWYSFDWTNPGKYKPIFFPKYDGRYKDADSEILVIRRPSRKPFFADCDYTSALPAANSELEMANFRTNHIEHSFQAGTLVNMNSGVPESEEEREVYKRKVIDKLTGTSTKDKVVVSFNENAAQALTIENLAAPVLGDSYSIFKDTCKAEIIEGHSVPSILFSSDRSGGGLGNNAEEIKAQTQAMYQKNIYPYRKQIINGLNKVFSKIDPTIDVYFQDFDQFNELTIKEIQE